MPPTYNIKSCCNYRALLFLAIYFVAAILALPTDSGAGELVISPTMRTALSFSDNVNLQSGSNRRSDFITVLSPGAIINYESPRLTSFINYRLHNIIYAKSANRNRSLHNLNARNTAEIVEDFLFFDGNVTMRQANGSLLRPQGDNINVNGNLQNLRQYSASPYVRRKFGNIATSEIRYARVLADSDLSTSFFNSQANVYNGSVLSGPAFQVLQWGLNYTRQDIDYDLRNDSVRLETGIANARYNINKRFGVTGTGGYENNTFGGGSFKKPKGVRWSAGFIWTPTPRTSIEASVGQRFFGDTYFVDASHRTRLFAINAGYRESINSAFNILNIAATGNTVTVLTNLFTGQAPPGTDPAEIAQLVQLLIVELGLSPNTAFASSFLTNRFFLQKNFESSIAFSAAKNTALVRVFHTTRRPIDNRPLLDVVLGGGFELANVKQNGVNVFLSHKISPRTRLNASFLYTRIFFPALNRRDQLQGYNASISREIVGNIFAVLSYRRRERSSKNVGAVGAIEFVENRFTAALNARF